MPLFIRAISVTQVGDGLFQVELPSRELTEPERELLRKLYPNLTDRAYDLLETENLLSAHVSNSDLPPKLEYKDVPIAPKFKKNDPSIATGKAPKDY